jgi:hypothetical protein
VRLYQIALLGQRRVTLGYVRAMTGAAALAEWDWGGLPIGTWLEAQSIELASFSDDEVADTIPR